MGGWATIMKIGRPRKELSFDGVIDGPGAFRQRLGVRERVVENSAGEKFRRRFRNQNADFTVGLSPPVSNSIKNQLESMLTIGDEPLSFIFADDWNMYSTRVATNGLTTVTLPSSPYSLLGAAYKDAGGADSDIIDNIEVFTTYDVAGGQGGTDYFLSYAADTRVVTLNPSPGAIGTVVYINWTYNGALVFMRPFRPRHRAGNISAGTAQWDISLQLDGI